MTLTTLHLAASISETGMNRLMKTYDQNDRIIALSNQARGRLRLESMSFSWYMDRIHCRDTWHDIHKFTERSFNFSLAQESHSQIWSAFLVHELCRDFLYCTALQHELRDSDVSRVILWQCGRNRNHHCSPFSALIRQLTSELIPWEFGGDAI